MNVSDTLYFGIALTGDENNRPANSVIQARRCWATPDGNPDNMITRYLISYKIVELKFNYKCQFNR